MLPGHALHPAQGQHDTQTIYNLHSTDLGNAHCDTEHLELALRPSRRMTDAYNASSRPTASHTAALPDSEPPVLITVDGDVADRRR